MLSLSSSRTLFSRHHHHHHQLYLNPHLQFQLALNFSSSKYCYCNHGLSPRNSFSLFVLRPASIPSSFSATKFRFLSNCTGNASFSDNDRGGPSPRCVHHAQSHPLSGCLSQNEDGQEPPSELLSPVAGGIVALGKFDALHVGHRELAIQASKVGIPFLLSFVGMAEVLGWEPRAPIVAKCDRKRVLKSWAPYCANVTPQEFEIDFSKVRSLSPRQFVEKLSMELGVHGVVAGENYRFGYRAAGDASDLVRLCEEYGMGAYIINSVLDKNQPNPNGIYNSNSKEQGQVSSTRVRHALSKGQMKYVSELLGRHHRLMLNFNQQECTVSDNKVLVPKSCLLNLAPVEGLYKNCCVLIGDEDVEPCRVVIDTTHIHLELEKSDICTALTSPENQLLGIDFGD
ncbi:OLC1v1030109C1 [Oldenlandia corymbosa var. corymbosa]|uniref:FAD synthase n=1 Tax=Oldenlandia corymbosa var. corymbosa TaxID=529605 RepID=A0AAV1CFA7_OLDCO|nr:OLC1v1030109C1 [Oldenlandia corymbosa var. corymbosa]